MVQVQYRLLSSQKLPQAMPPAAAGMLLRLRLTETDFVPLNTEAGLGAKA